MSMHMEPFDERDLAPGDEHVGSAMESLLGYTVGLVLALILTGTSFYVAGSDLIWKPGIPTGLVVLAVAQMGVHLAFFLHITTSPDSTNNVMALAFGVLIVLLVIAGSVWIMNHLAQNMMPMEKIMEMQG